MREVAEKVKPPRAVFIKWPFGSPVGEPGNVLQQRRILADMLEVVRGATVPGMIYDLPYKWRREDYAAVDGLKLG